MAYQAIRKKLYQEDLQLTEEDGSVVHTLHVSLDPDSIVAKLSEKHIALVRAMQDIQKLKESSNGSTDEKLKVLGAAVVDILEAVFGKEDALTIINFYNNRYVEMCREIIPFITEVVLPEVRKIASQNKKEVIGKYNRKQRRKLFGRK